MASVNKVFLLGNLGADPDVRYTPDGNRAIASLRVATNRRYRNRDDQQVTETEWHRVVVFGRSAEIARDYLKKGSNVWVEGRLRTRKWTDQAGADHYTTEIICENLQLGSRGRPEGDAPMDDSFESAPRVRQPASRPAAASPQASPAAPQASPAATSSPIDDIEEDVPF